MFNAADIVLTEGGVVERLHRHPAVVLDPFISHAGLVYEEHGRQILRSIYEDYIAVGQQAGLPFMSLAPTWRANPERVARSPYSEHDGINQDCVDLLRDIRAGYGDYASSIFIGGLMGCRGDAYRPQEALSQQEAAAFHRSQADSLAESGVDFIKVATLPALSEAIGMAATISRHDLPYILSFVIRADGTLLDGTPLHQAITRIDAMIQPPPFFYMINCVHPTIFAEALDHEAAAAEQITQRVLGLQANTSARSPEELDGLEHLDTSDPREFAEAVVELHRRYGIKVLGGCCGSDGRHMAEIARQVRH